MSESENVQRHYEAGGDEAGLSRKLASLLDGFPEPVTAAQLAWLDQFHVRGLAATVELAELAGLQPGMAVLDAGCGLGGPARFLAKARGCTVTGVDLAPSFVAAARMLTDRVGQGSRVSFEVGNVLALPFPSGRFDAVWTQHVAMNICDRRGLYREFSRVLKPGGMLAFYDVIAADGGSEPIFPVPWAESRDASFLLTKAATLGALEAVGFTPRAWNDVTAQAVEWLGQPRPPQPLSLAAVMGPRFGLMSANLARSLREGRAALAMGVFMAGSAAG